jgi:hypothetical protein
VFHIIGGTGEFTGITGDGSDSATPVKPSDGTGMLIVSNKASWKLP